jgi:acyl-CoA synthetase (AMP-forming)/AMP-acid ligase II
VTANTFTPFRTITELAEGARTEFPGQVGVFQDAQGREARYTAADLEEATRKHAGALQSLGLAKGERFGLVAVEAESFCLTFLAGVRLGAVPVPISPPLGLSKLEAFTAKTSHILANARASLLVAPARLQNVLWAQVDKVPGLRRLVTAESLDQGPAKFTPAQVDPEDLCLLQYTSGSTGQPRGVMVTHRQIIANCDRTANRMDMHAADDDKTVSWLPLYHDMGLIGMLLAPMLRGMPFVKLSPLRFLTRPFSWLEALHNHRGTATFAPLFAYALVVRRSKPEQLRALDLSRVKVFGCGAEPINPQVLSRFTDVLSTHCGLRRDAIFPAYGMAEATLALSMKVSGRVLRTRRCDRARFQDDQVVVLQEGEGAPPAHAPTHDTVEHVSCGPPLDDHDVAAFGPDGQRLPEGREGELWARGPSVTAGYFNDEEATSAMFRDGWLRTGDLGYLLDGEVHVTGRLKDLIILHGKNVAPQSVEWAVGEVEGVRKGCVAAFSCPGEESERLVVALETKTAEHGPIKEAVRRALDQSLGLVAADLVCLDPGALPKTSSGKLERRKTRAMYLEGTLGHHAPVGSSQLAAVNIVARSLWSRVKDTVQ